MGPVIDLRVEVVVKLDGFADPWEHTRLLSDAERNQALIALLTRHSPGNRVVEVGCGTGLLSCISAKLGAKKVYAVEPTPLWELAAQMVEDNGLQHIVEVLEGRVQDVEPRPVDLAFSELLNGDPFYEGVLSASRAVKPWVVEGGLLAPRRLRVYGALCRPYSSAHEVELAHGQIQALGDTYDLDLRGLVNALQTEESYRQFSNIEEPIGPATLLYDFELGGNDEPPETMYAVLKAAEPGPISGAMVWFEAEYDDNLVMSNPPGTPNHWGQLVLCWAQERGVKQGQEVRVKVTVEDEELDIQYLP